MMQEMPVPLPKFVARLLAILLRYQQENGSVLDRWANGVSPSHDPPSLPLIGSLTNHFIDALVACDYPLHDEHLCRAVAWFLRQVPPGEPLTTLKMNMLESLLKIGPEPEQIPDSLRDLGQVRDALLGQLRQQREVEGYYQIQDLSDHQFGDLWGTKLLLLAMQKGLLSSEALADLLKADIDEMVKTQLSGMKHKDQALALSLRFQLYGHLTRGQRIQLQNLLEFRHEKLWGWTRNEAQRFRKHLANGLDVGQMRNVQEFWYEVFSTTCYVLENLAPLVAAHREMILPVYEDALHYLFDRLAAPDMLYGIFQDPRYIPQLAARLIVAAMALTDGDHRVRLQRDVLRASLAQISESEMPDPRRDYRELDYEGVDEALRNWFPVRFDQASKLTLGISGSTVARVQPYLQLPAISGRHASRRMPIQGFDTVIVKYGSVDVIQRELENYRQLPPRLRQMFASIPTDFYIPPSQRNREAGVRQAFIIIQDLTNFDVLLNVLPQAGESNLPHLMVDFLRDFHDLESQGRLSSRKQSRTKGPRGVVRRMYLDSMGRYLNSFFSLLYSPPVVQRWHEWRSEVLPGGRSLQALEQSLRVRVVQLYDMAEELETFPTTYVHGDLHTRNILIWGFEEGGRDHGEILIRLIDLEDMHSAGDYVLDVGQLWTSLDDMKPGQGPVRVRPVQQLMTLLEDTYAEQAEAIRDVMFPTRLALAKARARLRLAHARANRGRDVLLPQAKYPDLMEEVQQALALVVQAADLLEDAFA